MLNKLSIIVPVKDDTENLLQLLQSLAFEPNIEVIVISPDDLKSMESRYDFVRFIQHDSTVGEARNIGIKAAKYAKIAMLDADTLIYGDWVNEALNSLDYYDIVAGYTQDQKGNPSLRVSIYIKGQDITFPQCNIAYNKYVFDIIGGLREDMSVAEDCEFHYRCVWTGFVISYNPSMKVIHYRRPTTISWIQQCFKNGFGRAELERIHPELKHRHEHGVDIEGLIKLIFGFMGYSKAKLFGIKYGRFGVRN